MPTPKHQPLKHQEGLPVHNGEYKVSLLFLMVSPRAIVTEDLIVIPQRSPLVVFSDRPHRIARAVDGGASAFAALYGRSDFLADPPNVTFAATDDDGNEQYTVFELGQPQLEDDRVLLPIRQILGDERRLPPGEYRNASLVVDNVWDTIGDVAEIAGGVVGTVAAGIGTAAACTVGEVATLGAATAVCVGGVVGTIAAGGATAGKIASTAGGDD